MGLLRRFNEAIQKGHAWRPMTLWSWNDRLDPEEIRRQIREMALGGLGGHFMHARRGLETPYLGPEWMEAVRTAIEEGSHTGVTPWLYDEDCWPSGACSGRVYAGREAFRQRCLVFEVIQPAGWEPAEDTVAVFVATKDARGRYQSFRRLSEPRAACGKRPGRRETVLHFLYRTLEHADVFNREATQEFLKQTHERYRATVGGEFGRALPGIFTEGPHYAGGVGHVPWSTALLKFFRRACHYDLVDHLPSLFLRVGNYRKVRFDFYWAATRLFLLAWTMPIYQWCDRHHLALTGHLMNEDTLLEQVQATGAAMPHYEYMHIPGVDHLGRGLGSPILVKQAASVAAQCGRPRVLGEVFGGSGWDLRFDDMRRIAEWQGVLGVNLLCQHLAALSLRGSRKRDYPPSLHYHQPWWPQFYLWNDYAASLLAVLTAGSAVADVLVIHPVTSAWAEYAPLDERPVRDLDEHLRRLVDFILGTHADFHFGDELILQRKAAVDRKALEVGACRYRVVVVPDATNLCQSTVDLLEAFRKAGGRVVFAGRVPALVDGEPSKAVSALARRCTRADVRTARGRAALRRALDPQVEVLNSGGKDAAGILAQWRTVGEDHAFFFVNTDERRSCRARLRLPVSGTPIILEPGESRCHEAKASVRGRKTTMTHTFGPRESLLLVVRAGGERDALVEPPRRAPGRREVLRGRWNLRRQDPNVLVLDTVSWRTDEGQYAEPMNILDVQQELLQRGAQQVIVLKFEFDCAIRNLEGRRLELVLEQPEAYELWVNGMRAPLANAGPYWDGSLRRVDIAAYVRRGANTIELKRPWFVDGHRRNLLMGRTTGWEAGTAVPNVELEAVYVIGDFGVSFRKGTRKAARGSRWMRGRPRMTDEPGRITGTDLIRAGYPFFAGRLTLEREVLLKHEPSAGAVLELPPVHAASATVHVNGLEAATVWKAPWTVPVGGLVTRGRNRVAVTLTTSLRNMLGPHHHEDGELHCVGPQSFACCRGWYGRSPGHRCAASDYNVVDFGLAGEVVLRY